jgi:WD40 repeat protein
VREEIEADTALPQAHADITQALTLDPELTIASGLKASADALEALNRYESEPEQATADFEAAMADLETIAGEDPDSAAGNYLSMLPTLAGLKTEDRAWLTRQADEATAQLAQDPESYVAYGARGLVRLFLGSQPSPDMQTLQQAGQDLLYSIALAHRRMPDLANPEGGPLQVARIWDVQEAAYASGSLYNQVFFSQIPQSFPQFGQMLSSYCELHSTFAEMVDDPIVFSVAFSPDGTQIATLSESGPSYLRLYDAATGEKLQETELGLDGMVVATTSGNLDYSPDGRLVVAAYTNPVARVIDTQTGEVTLEISHTASIHSVAFSPDGKRIVTIDPETAAPVVWDAETGERVLTATFDLETAAPGVWDTDPGERVVTVTLGSAVSTVTFSPDGRQIVGGGEQVHIWDAETGELLTTLPGYEAGHRTAPAMSPDGTLLAMPGNPARVYDLIAETELYTITAGAATAVFSPDGSRLATAGFDVAGVWDAHTGDLVFLAGHPGGVDSVDFSPDGRYLVTGGSDGRFRVWDAETGAELWNGMAATLWWEQAD